MFVETELNLVEKHVDRWTILSQYWVWTGGTIWILRPKAVQYLIHWIRLWNMIFSIKWYTYSLGGRHMDSNSRWISSPHKTQCFWTRMESYRIGTIVQCQTERNWTETQITKTVQCLKNDVILWNRGLVWIRFGIVVSTP